MPIPTTLHSSIAADHKGVRAQPTVTAETFGLTSVSTQTGGRFIVEASTLGLPPGEFPKAIATTLGNGRPFIAQFADADSVRYRQEAGTIGLEILND